MEKNKKIIYSLSISLIVVLLIFGILYGWFRFRESLPPAQAAQLESITLNPQVDKAMAEGMFSKLWLDHVYLTRQVILSEFNKSPELEANVAALLQNQKDIAQAVDLYYPGSYQIVADLLTEHITVAKDILDDLRDLRLLRLSPDINKWYRNADLIGEAMMKINENWHMTDHMHTHLRITEREAIYEWLGFNTLSKNIYEKKIKPQAEGMATMMSSNL